MALKSVAKTTPLRGSAVSKDNHERLISVEERLTIVEESHTALASSVLEIKENTESILFAINGASKIGAFIKRHGPRVFAFSMGILVASGYISQSTAHDLLKIFGL